MEENIRTKFYRIIEESGGEPDRDLHRSFNVVDNAKFIAEMFTRLNTDELRAFAMNAFSKAETTMYDYGGPGYPPHICYVFTAD